MVVKALVPLPVVALMVKAYVPAAVPGSLLLPSPPHHWSLPRRKPLLSLCALAVFKPAIIIHDFYAVILIRYMMLGCHNCRCLGLPLGHGS